MKITIIIEAAVGADPLPIITSSVTLERPDVTDDPDRAKRDVADIHDALQAAWSKTYIIEDGSVH